MEPSSLFRRLLAGIPVLAGLLVMAPGGAQPEEPAGSYEDLVALFKDWRDFERPAFDDGVPDYTAEAMAAKHEKLKEYRERLEAIDTSDWPVEKQVDYHLVRAEMNGLDFNIRVLKPWARDPAFYKSAWTYQSDTPAHEGPSHHALVELWQYDLPLSDAAEAKLAGELATIPPLLEQARGNLTGNARDLWNAGTQTMRIQVSDLEDLAGETEEAGEAFRQALDDAIEATRSFVAWLEKQAPSKTGPSGIGKDHYTWYLQHVHLVPMTWEDEERLLKKALNRAWSALALEEHRNRDLPPMETISSPEEYERRFNEAITSYIAFLEDNEVLPVKPYMDEALRERTGEFTPADERNFFAQVIHRDPRGLLTHFYHWWDLARMEKAPHDSPIRRGPLLYNIFDSRAEGMATAMEEMMMHAGLYDDSPRSRELVWIMLAQRAARGLGSLYAHSNDYTMAEAADFHVKNTPRGWMREDLDLLSFEQQLYLRQPGYGTTYVTGKYLVESLLAERRRELKEDFTLSGFFQEVNAAGVIPVSLIRWELTGDGSEVRRMLAGEPET